MIAVGGGKIFDTAKAVAYYNDIPVIIAPTIAADALGEKKLSSAE